MASREAGYLNPSQAVPIGYGTADRRSVVRTRFITRRGLQAAVFASASLVFICALVSVLPNRYPRTTLVAAPAAAPSETPTPPHVATSPIPVIASEIKAANHELGDAAARQAEDIQIDTEEHDAFKQIDADVHSVAKLEGKLAGLEKNAAASKRVAALEQDIKRVDTEEAGLELAEHALHKDQASEVELQNTIFEEESAIGEAEKDKQAVATRIGHLQADLVSESRLRGKIDTETSEFAAAAHSYEQDSAHVLDEEDAIQKQLHSDVDQPDQQEVHKELLDAREKHVKESAALGKEVDGDHVVAHDFDDLAKDDQHVAHQESDNNVAAGGASSAAASH